MSYREKLWNHRPLTDFWRVGRGYTEKLEAHGLYTMGDIARCSLGKSTDWHNEDLLYKLFGINAELLIDHAWGWEPCLMSDIKAYKPSTNSLSSGQVLHCPYDGEMNGSIHFHALIYVPENEMIGEIVEKREYSTKRGEMRTRYGNTFFDDNFGISDFQEVNPVLLKRGGTSRYLVKYITKTGEKVVYSRGTPAEICKELSDNDVVGTYLNFVTKYVLWDDVLDWERDIKDYGKKTRLCL